MYSILVSIKFILQWSSQFVLENSRTKKTYDHSQLGMSYSRGVTTDPRSVIQTINIFDDGRQTVWDKDILHQDAVNKCKNEKLFFISNLVGNKIDLIHSATDHRC